MRNILLAAAIVTLVALQSCKDSSAVVQPPLVPPSLAERLADLTNVYWTLSKATIGDSTIDLTTYQPFDLWIHDTLLAGTDGCNDYGSNYVLAGDSLNAFGLGLTMAWCRAPQFPARNICGHWFVEISDSTLVLRNEERSLRFSSSHTKSIRGVSFTEKRWDLQSSNDPDANSLLGDAFLYDLVLAGDRSITLRESFSMRDSNHYCDNREWLYGLGGGSSIILHDYPGGGECRSARNHSDPLKYLTFTGNLAKCNAIAYTDSTLNLTDSHTGNYYHFVREK